MHLTHPTTTPHPEPSAERLFFALAAAFLGATAVIITTALVAPVGVGVVVSLVVIALAVWAVVSLLSSFIGED